VDSRFTHTFIHDAIVHAMGLDVMLHPSLSVKVANGERLQSYGACKATKVLVQGKSFVMNCYALPLKGFDVILGVQWLKLLGPIMWDFAALTMAFVRELRSVHLVGCGGTPSALYSQHPTKDIMGTLLKSYSNIFEEPRGLPPQWSHDHHIHLMPGMLPIAVQPYRYLQLLKDEVEASALACWLKE
jgi:hypothetical protein